jgi:hypothetical protein
MADGHYRQELYGCTVRKGGREERKEGRREGR